MLRQGPIPAFVHGLLEYLVGVVFVAAPFLLDFDGSATAVSIVVGIVLLVVAASTDSPAGLSKTVPISVHVVLDFVLAAVLVAAPFLFGFSDDTEPTVLFVVAGVVHVLVTIGTRFLPARATA